MDKFSPKIEIINHFDNLINRVDIEIEECLLKYNHEQIIGDLECIRNERNFKFSLCFHLSFFTSSFKENNNKSVKVWPKSAKIIDYLNQVRERTINELREAQKDSIEYFNSVSYRFKMHDKLIEEKKLDEIKSQMYGEKFYFQVHYEPKEKEEEDDEEEEDDDEKEDEEEKEEGNEKEEWILNLYTIVTDFYMSPVDINLLE